jgi:hypothetical protein
MEKIEMLKMETFMIVIKTMMASDFFSVFDAHTLDIFSVTSLMSINDYVFRLSFSDKAKYIVQFLGG